MRLNFGALFQKYSKDRSMGGLARVPTDRTQWPPSWTTTEFKNYDEQFPGISLPSPSLPLSFDEAIRGRRSVRAWNTTPLTCADLSNILYYSCGTIRKALHADASNRAQASAGKRYPLEAYVINLKEGELEKAVYHYMPEAHMLQRLWPLSMFENTLTENLSSYAWAHDAAALIILTAVVDRSVRKYGERAYRYMYLEAGAIANAMNVIGSIGSLGSVILGGTNDEVLEELLDIDGEEETVLIGCAVGNRM